MGERSQISSTKKANFQSHPIEPMLRCLQIGYHAILAVMNHSVVMSSKRAKIAFLLVAIHWCVLMVEYGGDFR